MALNGNIAAPIIFLLVFNIVQFAVRYWLMYWSYDLGTGAIEVLTRNAKEFTHAASMLGVFVVGALTCNYGATTLKIAIENGESDIIVQDILNGVLPQLIPLALTLMLYFLIKKKGWSTIKCIVLLLVIGIVGAAFGIWGGDYTPLIQWYTAPIQ